MMTHRGWPGGLVLGLVLVASACGDPTVAPPAGPPTSLIGGLFGTMNLLRCEPLQAESVHTLIGPEGGRLAVGPHTLVVPAGALAEPVTIIASIQSGAERLVSFAPEGLTFAADADLTLSYAGCDGLALLLLPKTVVQVDDHLELLDLLPSMDNLAARTVSSRLRHFSNYAIAW